MSKDYKVTTFGAGCYIIVANYPAINEIANARYYNKESINKKEYAIGYWKPKNK